MGPIGMKELVILLVIVLIIFGPKKLPGLGRAIGQSIKEFKEGVKGLGNVLEDDTKNETKVASAEETDLKDSASPTEEEPTDTTKS